MSERPVLLILTGSFGHGHNTAARNLEAAFTHLLGTQMDVEVVDFFGRFYPEISSLLQKGYEFTINNAPMLWKQLYRLANVSRSSMLSFNTVVQQMAGFLREKRPIVVVSTFPIYSMLFEQLFAKQSERPFRFYTVVTDSISINAMWCQGQSDLMFVTDNQSKRVVMQEGVPEDRIQAHGFPIPFSFHASVRPLLPPDRVRPRILYLPTTKRAHVRLTIEHLVAWSRQRDVEITIVLGHHQERLSGALQTLHDNLPASKVTILGWVTDIPTLMTEHHVVLTKAGGATVNEALGAQCPLIINYVVPGQEEGNAQLVLQSQCGCRIHTPEELPRALTHILVDNDAATWRRYRANLSDLDRASASLRIAQEVIDDSNVLTTSD